MIESVMYVLKENINNLFRIYSIAKYEILSDIHDSKLGIFWNFAHPLIQVFTYWFAFGFVFNRKAITYNEITVPFIYWLMGGMIVWQFISPCITNGCNAVFAKREVITKMKFPVSILPTTVVLKELFNHFCLFVILINVFTLAGYAPTIHWLGLVYYCICGILFGISISLITSVLNMIARDTRKLIMACMRLLLYVTPVIWSLNQLEANGASKWLIYIMKYNPIYYVVQGYRDCFFYHEGIFSNFDGMIIFWTITIILFVIGSKAMYKFKNKFIDLL